MAAALSFSNDWMVPASRSFRASSGPRSRAWAIPAVAARVARANRAVSFFMVDLLGRLCAFDGCKIPGTT
ncbi:hypothetical protein D3C72_2120690 [compost metagenome]